MIFAGKPRRRAIAISLVGILFVLVCGVFAAVSLRHLELTRTHQEEMRMVIQHFYQTLYSVEGQSNPQIMAEIAANGYLDYLVRVRCDACPSIEVARRLNVVELQVLDYSPQSAKVYARIEYGWNKVSPTTGQVIGPCHAQAFSGIATVVWEDGLWKVSGGEDVDANRVDDSPQLLAQYCSDK